MPNMFPAFETITVALTSGWIPEDVAASTVSYVLADKGGVIVTSAIPASAKRQLRQVGVTEVDVPKRAKVQVLTASCWTELIPCSRHPQAGTEVATMIFVVRGNQVAMFASEILRLGCPRQELRMLEDGRALIRVIEAPYFAITRALDRVDGIRAFRAAGPGLRVYIELGYDHPLAGKLTVPAGTHVFVPGDGSWFRVPEGEWDDLMSKVDLTVPASVVDAAAAPEVPRIDIQLRLAHAARPTAPRAFVLPIEAERKLHTFIRTVPEHVLDSMLFAVTRNPDRIIVAARPGKQAYALTETAEAFAPHPLVPQIMIPVDASLEPPVDRDHLSSLLTPRAGSIAFVRRHPNGGIDVERVPENALAPLTNFVDWIVDQASDLRAWRESADFRFTVDISPDAPAQAPRPDSPGGGGGDSGGGSSPSGGSGRRSKTAAAPNPNTPPLTFAAAEPLPPTELQRRLSAAEARFASVQGAPDAPERLPVLTEMGDLLSGLNRYRDASLCYVRVAWEADATAAATLAGRWASGVAATTGSPLSPQSILTAALAAKTPSSDQIRAAAAALVAGATAPVTTLSPWLEQYGDALDVRSLWLAWLRVSELSGGDRLALARARDVVLFRLGRGLSMERDVPSFVRFMGGGPAENRNTDRLAKGLLAFAERIPTMQRARSPVEASLEKTRAYQALAAAYGLVRLGHADRGRTLAVQAAAQLDGKDPIHAWVLAAYQARIQQAAEGLVDQPLPPSLLRSRDALERFQQYKINRLCESSAIIDGNATLDSIQTFQAAERPGLAQTVRELRAMTNPGDQQTPLTKLVDSALAKDGAERFAELDAAIDFFAGHNESYALPQLRRYIPAVEGLDRKRRGQLLGKVLSLAGHFGDSTLASQATSAYLVLLRDRDGLADADAGPAIARSVALVMRALRRVGLREEANRLFAAVHDAAAASGNGIGAQIARVHLAGALGHLGRHSEVPAVLTPIVEFLHLQSTQMHDKLFLGAAFARAVGTMSEEHAIGVLTALEQALTQITDSYNTNSHFCVSALAFTESIVLGYANEDLVIGEAGRRYIEEDEHIVRAKIQRDLARA